MCLHRSLAISPPTHTHLSCCVQVLTCITASGPSASQMRGNAQLLPLVARACSALHHGRNALASQQLANLVGAPSQQQQSQHGSSLLGSLPLCRTFASQPVQPPSEKGDILSKDMFDRTNAMLQVTSTHTGPPAGNENRAGTPHLIDWHVRARVWLTVPGCSKCKSSSSGRS